MFEFVARVKNPATREDADRRFLIRYDTIRCKVCAVKHTVAVTPSVSVVVL